MNTERVVEKDIDGCRYEPPVSRILAPVLLESNHVVTERGIGEIERALLSLINRFIVRN
jgi:hypothetical protein